MNQACSGVDFWPTKIPTFFPGYRGGYQTMLKMMNMFNVEMAGGKENYYTLYDSHIPADLMALSGRLQSAEDKGEIEALGLDPALVEQRQKMMEQGKRREQDMAAWVTKLIQQFKGQRVKIGVTFSGLYRVAKTGLDNGTRCEFSPGSVLMGGGGMKGYKDAPDDWEENCSCGWGGPRAEKTIRRFSESEGGDDKITCAGSQQAYNEFMAFVSGEDS